MKNEKEKEPGMNGIKILGYLPEARRISFALMKQDNENGNYSYSLLSYPVPENAAAEALEWHKRENEETFYNEGFLRAPVGVVKSTETELLKFAEKIWSEYSNNAQVRNAASRVLSDKPLDWDEYEKIGDTLGSIANDLFTTFSTENNRD